MKRFLLLATAVAFLAAGCQKTEVENEVLTPIGFSTKVGKQVKSIVGTTFDEDQPFGVYTYSTTGTTVMNNIEIRQTTEDGNKVYKPTNNIDYYWPNDVDTKLSFYAYSPYCGTNAASVKNHQKINGTLTHTVGGGFAMTGYQHTNMYVDFMVSDPIVGATYADPNGTTANVDGQTEGKVPVLFNHRMTQILFTVKTDVTYSNKIKFELQSITINNAYDKADIANGQLVDPIFIDNVNNKSSFAIYPAKIETDQNGAPNLDANQSAGLVIDNTASTFEEIIPVTMIPQTLVNQSFTVKYKITPLDATAGVAEETVEKTFKFTDNGNVAEWAANKKIIYHLTVGLKKITFDPKVATWSETTGAYDINPNN